MEARFTSWQDELDALLPPDIQLQKLQQPEPATELANAKRTLMSNVRRALYMSVIAFSADTAIVMNSEVEQPQPIVSYNSQYHYVSLNQVSTVADAIPSPDQDVQTIIDALDTDEKYKQFTEKHCNSMMPKTPWTFLQTYAFSPEEFQENNWTGPCNAYAEFSCEVGQRHGKQMYQLAMWPNEKKCAPEDATLDDLKHSKSWHIVSFYKKRDYRTGKTQYVVFNNNTVTELEEGASLQSWIDSQNYQVIQPMGGIIKWQRPVHDWRAELGRHLAFTLSEADIEETIIGEPATLIAQK